MTYNGSSRYTHAELLEIAARRIVNEWSGDGALGDRTGNGVTIEEARAAVERCFVRQRRLGPELARAEAEAYLWPDDAPTIDLTDIPGQRGSVDVTPDWVLYLDGPHSHLVYGRTG